MVFDRISAGLSGPSKYTAVALVLANIVPVIGAMLWGWSAFQIVALYWAETLLIGLLNIPKIFISLGPDHSTGKLAALSKPAMAIFFAVHFAVYFVIHGFLIFSLLGDQALLQKSLFGIAKLYFAVLTTMGGIYILMILSHLFSFFFNFVGKRTYREMTPSQFLFRPYRRIVIMQIILLFGAIAIEMVGTNPLLVVGLIALKMVMDMAFHLYFNANEEDMMRVKGTTGEFATI